MTRRLGRTGLEVPELTIGTAAWRTGDAAEIGAMIGLAAERDVTAFEIDAGDSAAVDLLARGGRRGMLVHARVTSLVPFDLPSPHVSADHAYPRHHIRAETEGLLRRLGVERLALQQLHAWCPEWLHEGDWRETLERLREEGKIAGFGVSLFDHDADAGLTAVAEGAIDSVQAMYNVFDPAAAELLFPLCRRHDVGAIARSPLYYGALAGRVDGFADWRGDYFYGAHARETRERVERLREAGPLPELALRFALSHPAVSTVAVGVRTRAQLETALHAIEMGPLGAEQCASLAGHAWLC